MKTKNYFLVGILIAGFFYSSLKLKASYEDEYSASGIDHAGQYEGAADDAWTSNLDSYENNYINNDSGEDDFEHADTSGNGLVTEADCSSYGNYVPSSDRQDCVPAGSGDTSGNGLVTEADCRFYGNYVPSSDRQDCVPAGSENSNCLSSCRANGGNDTECAYECGTASNSNCLSICRANGGNDTECASECRIGGNLADDNSCLSTCRKNGGNDTECASECGSNKSECSTNENCTQILGEGYKCESGTCMVDGFFDATECRTDADCERYYGTGFTCSGLFVSTCERRVTSTNNNGTGGSAPRPVANMSQPTVINGKQITSGQIYSDGSVYQNGVQVAPPGTYNLSGLSGANTDGNFRLCANAITGEQECRDINGNEIPGSSITLIGNPGTYAGGVAGISGASLNTASTCGNGFQKVGGVCFPTSSMTGLSDAPIYVILANIFSWLMGLFTTLAILAFVISGVQYLMSSADEDMAKSAKKNANNALIGIIVGLSGFIIVKAIAAALSGQGYFF